MKLLSDLRYKARKEHICNYCGGIIKVGESYGVQNIVDGKFYMWKFHITCDRIAWILDMHDSCEEGVSASDFQHCIEEEYLRLKEEKKLKISEITEDSFLNHLILVKEYHQNI